MKSFDICIELPVVIPFQAPRRHGNLYFNPLSKEKRQCQALILRQYQGKPLIGPINCMVKFELAVPCSISEKKKLMLLNTPCIKKIDLDNCMKFLGDCMKGILFADDSQICSSCLTKTWQQKDKTIVYLWQDHKEEENETEGS